MQVYPDAGGAVDEHVDGCALTLVVVGAGDARLHLRDPLTLTPLVPRGDLACGVGVPGSGGGGGGGIGGGSVAGGDADGSGLWLVAFRSHLMGVWGGPESAGIAHAVAAGGGGGGGGGDSSSHATVGAGVSAAAASSSAASLPSPAAHARTTLVLRLYPPRDFRIVPRVAASSSSSSTTVADALGAFRAASSSVNQLPPQLAAAPLAAAAQAAPRASPPQASLQASSLPSPQAPPCSTVTLLAVRSRVDDGSGSWAAAGGDARRCSSTAPHVPVDATGLPLRAGPTHGSSSGHASSSDAAGDSDGAGPAAKRLRVGADEQTVAAASRGPLESSALPSYSSAPQEAGPSRQVTLSFRDAAGDMFVFTVKPTARLRRLFAVYCIRKELPLSSVRFLHDGRKLCEELRPGVSATVQDNGLEDGDVIEVKSTMTGD